MSADTGEIIIKGGSVDLQYDDDVYVQDPSDPRRHKNPTRKITRVVIVDDRDVVRYDSDYDENGLRWTVTVQTKS